jgi:glutaredoxin
MTYTVYTKEMCPMCDKAKALLTNKEMKFTTIMIVGDDGITDGTTIRRTDFMEKFPGIRTAPFIIDPNGKYIKSFQELAQSL